MGGQKNPLKFWEAEKATLRSDYRPAVPVLPAAKRRNEFGEERAVRFDLSGFSQPDWMADALCKEYPKIEFVAGPTENGGSDRLERDRAVDVCKRCLVTVECLDHALANTDLVGVWGGTTTRLRNLIRKGKEPVSPWACKPSTDVVPAPSVALVSINPKGKPMAAIDSPTPEQIHDVEEAAWIYCIAITGDPEPKWFTDPQSATEAWLACHCWAEPDAITFTRHLVQSEGQKMEPPTVGNVDMIMGTVKQFVVGTIAAHPGKQFSAQDLTAQGPFSAPLINKALVDLVGSNQLEVTGKRSFAQYGGSVSFAHA